MEQNSRVVLLIGRPGSGKGTQAKVLAEAFGWERLSSGDRFKELRDSTSALSDRVREAYDAGKFLPDWFAAYLFEDVALNLDASKGMVAEGFGRTKAQAEHLISVTSWLDRELVAVHLNVSEEEALRRQMERAKTEDRPDSNAAEKIRARFDEFTANTAPALTFFKEKGMLIEINGEQSPSEVAECVRNALNV
jgi:adenylate kinase